MKRWILITFCAGAAAFLIAPTAAHADTRDARLARYLPTFKKLKGETLSTLKTAYAAAPGKGSKKLDVSVSRTERAQSRFANVAVRAPALDDETALNAIDRASAAIKTSIQGAEAGLSVAPIALAGLDDSPHQINVTLAALKDTKTRFGLAYSYEVPWVPMGPEDLGLDECNAESGEKELTKQIESARTALFRVCETVVVPLIEPVAAAEADKSKLIAAYVCGIDIPPALMATSFGQASVDVALGIDIVVKKIIEPQKKRLEKDEAQDIAGAAARRFDFEERLASVNDSLTVLAAVKPPTAYQCYDDKKLDAAKKVATWAHRKHRLGVGGTTELFPLVLGFSPDGKDLPHGQLQRWQAKAEYAMVSGLVGLSLGGGVGQWRDAFIDPFHTFVSPAFSTAIVLGSLTREPLTDPQGRVLLVNGELPPRLTLGVDVSLDIALNRPDSQVTVLQKFNGTLFLDFLYTDKLAFRLGMPVSAETKVRAADPKASPPVEEKRNLQWTFPVALTTVIKM